MRLSVWSVVIDVAQPAILHPDQDAELALNTNEFVQPYYFSPFKIIGNPATQNTTLSAN